MLGVYGGNLILHEAVAALHIPTNGRAAKAVLQGLNARINTGSRGIQQ